MTETRRPSALDPGVSVSLLGTGPMGAPIARNIINAGVPLTLWNRTLQKAEAIEGGTVALRPAEAAADVVLTVLPDLPQIEALLARHLERVDEVTGQTDHAGLERRKKTNGSRADDEDIGTNGGVL